MLSSVQAFVYGHAVLGAGVTSPDTKIAELGLSPNSPLPPIPFFVIYSEGPDLPYRYYQLRPEPLTKRIQTIIRSALPQVRLP